MDVLADLETLAAFVGTRVPLSSPNPQLLPLLTHPSHTTFPWAPLRIALESFFGTPDAIDPARVQGGWAGLRCYIAAFKRLEAVDSEAETAEVMTWLLALKDAAIQTSLFCKAPETDMLYDVLAGLHTPVTAEDLPALVARAGSNAASLPAWQTIASGSTSFERGGDGPLSPSPPLKAALPAVFPRPSLEEVVSSASSVDKNLPTAKRPQAPAPTVVTHLSQQGVKRKRSASIEQVSLGLRARDSTVSTSALSSFADFSDRAERDGEEDELEEDDDDDEDVDELDGSIASSTSSRNFLPTRSAGRSSTTAKSAASVSNSNNGNSHVGSSKVELLAQRLSSVTGIPFAKCLETVARVPKEELNNVDPSAPIPATLFPSALAVTTVAPPAVAPPAPSHKSTKRSNPTEDREDGRKVVRSHDPNRPAFSYSALIGQAILSTSDKRMRLAEIYEYVTANYPYYTKNECGWQNSIRHNLSLQPVFAKMTDQGAPGKKGCHWMILESEEWRFADGGWRKIDTKGEPKVKKEKEKKVRKSQSKKNLKSDASSGGGFEDNGASSEFTLDRAAGKSEKNDDDDFSE